ncbi:agglutinin-2-like [Salvia miltiorrhiza]|uniref:agglutinin-2-like n=1 Tax=Salvia miltiorrhiza TaxID=226208 RepID=UPI0025AD5F26|nr:agglutinin-2-like [Salvia miltiorrhiza]
MAKLLQTLILLLFCIAFFLMLANKATSQKTSFTFTSFVANSTDLTYQGDAHVPDGARSLRLTKTDANGLPRPSSIGRVLYSKPFKLWENSIVVSFNTTIKFTITPTKGPAADGLAFFMAPVGTTIPPGSYGGNLGLFDPSGDSPAASTFFAVEFDLYSNGWDPSHDLPHIGIDISSIKSSNFVKFGDSCIGKEAQLHIQYDGINFIDVTLKCDKETRLLEYEYDLGEILPSQVQVGIASSTGDLVALHDIDYWSFRSAEHAGGSKDRKTA